MFVKHGASGHVAARSPLRSVGRVAAMSDASFSLPADGAVRAGDPDDAWDVAPPSRVANNNNTNIGRRMSRGRGQSKGFGCIRCARLGVSPLRRGQQAGIKRRGGSRTRVGGVRPPLLGAHESPSPLSSGKRRCLVSSWAGARERARARMARGACAAMCRVRARGRLAHALAACAGAQTPLGRWRGAARVRRWARAPRPCAAGAPRRRR